jgi:hypothetical protein
MFRIRHIIEKVIQEPVLVAQSEDSKWEAKLETHVFRAGPTVL